jgi:hypothetical protein
METVPEAEELERAAEYRLRQADAAGPEERPGLEAAAALLERLAGEVRALGASPVLAEYRCVANWLAESGDVDVLADLAFDYRLSIGVTAFPPDGEAYLAALLALAKRIFGAG